MRYHHTPIRLTKLKVNYNTKFWHEYGDAGSVIRVGENVKWYSRDATPVGSHLNNNTQLLQPSNYTLGHLSHRNKNIYSHRSSFICKS